MEIPKFLVRNQYFHEKSDFGVPGEECARCNPWETIGITVLFACQRRRAQNWWNCRKYMEIIKLHWKSWNFVDFNENDDFSCFQPPATLHETFVFLRKKQGLSSLALRGCSQNQNVIANSEIRWSFMKSHKAEWISMKVKKIMFWDARERMWALQPLLKHGNHLFWHAGAIRWIFSVNSVKFIGKQEVHWKCRILIKIMELHETHRFSGFPDPSRNLRFPCSKSRS